MTKINTKFALILLLTGLLLPGTGQAIEVDTEKPFEFTCVVSAYYSPLPDQERYSTGSYEEEIRLNGNGTNGADGTEVYLGMIAAPSEFPFGTTINIAGFGVGEVHDRGGAINQNRIDIWMGHGDEGLARALNWGMRTTTCTTYFPGVALDAQVQELTGDFKMPPANMPANVTKDKAIGKNLHLGSEGEAVKELQQKLTDYGYYQGEIHGQFDEATRSAVISFQTDHGVVAAAHSYGAGYVGHLTWNALKSGQKIQGPILATQTGNVLDEGATGSDVIELQTQLKELGYFTYPVITGYYGPATSEAVLEFQLEHGVVSDQSDLGAGQYGPVTKQALREVLGLEKPQPQLEGTIMKLGDESEAVTELQHKLKKIGYFTYPEITGYYGQATADAVYNFQLSQGIVRSLDDFGAGQFGPVTRQALDMYLSDMLAINPQVATAEAKPEQNIFINNESVESVNMKFERDLDYGATGEDVVALQTKLRSLGYDKPGFYGVITKEAVYQFQIEHGIVQSWDDPGAGVLGPTTRNKLNAL